ncbi:putative carboxymethylenebutenolidase [Dictyobacter vulcani]|uniref:Putative carboxymethylenebutenolidase n=1 Tax=Dictyobacter vulcani TaxID=2607529 RepID=A0A5J4KUA8_9CHLR|nr:dienelactone hydrolase family protein [Dictyobacter vulcani]GER89649.1 putative carboxymethylenebutenolidase [Dictyobacter vulcani]
MLIHSQIVEFKGEGTSTYGYLAHPKGEGIFPGVVVLQEWWGIDTHIQQVTEHLAQEGFAALAPDLYRGQVATTIEVARHLSQQLDQEQVLQELQQAMRYLEHSPLVQSEKVGGLGFGMGGHLATLLASTGITLGALVILYGDHDNPANITPETSIHDTNAPFLGIYGGQDETRPQEYINELKEKLTSMGTQHQIIIYPHASRSFLNPDRDTYRAEDANDAWQHTVSWLRQHLINTQPPQP